jgi:transcriptional regulator with XRE-family HTH domain
MLTDHCLAGLKSIRQDRGISPPDLARAIGVTTNSYYRYERGDARIQFDKVCLLADMLGCSLDDLRHAPEAPAIVQWDVVE